MVLILIGNPPFVKLPFVNLYHTFINCDCAKYDKKHIFRANIIIWSIYNVIFQFSSFETSLRSKGPSIKDVQYTHFWAFLTPPSPLAYKRTFLVRGHTTSILTFIHCVGGMYKPRGQNFGQFWPPPSMWTHNRHGIRSKIL